MQTEIRTKDKKNSPQYHGLGVLLNPPEGYKHISFTFVPPPEGKNALPILTPQEQSKLLAEKIEKRSASGTSASSQNQHTKVDPKPVAEEETSASKEKPSRLPWIIAGVLLVGILSFLFKVIKGKSTS